VIQDTSGEFIENTVGWKNGRRGGGGPRKIDLQKKKREEAVGKRAKEKKNAKQASGN
jgi:hypothetical protein